MIEDIEDYAQHHRQFFDDAVPELVRDCLARGGGESITTILDAGCGDGSLARALASGGHLRDRRLLACDASASRVERLRGVSGVEAFVDDVQELKHVADGSIDLFVSSQVIEHVDDGRMAHAIERVTHRGSKVYVSTVFRRWYGWYFYRSPAGWALDPTHLREYRSDDELLAKFSRRAFRLVTSSKTPIAYPIGDAVLRTLRAGPDVYQRSAVWRTLRAVRVPIVGYSSWELVFDRI